MEPVNISEGAFDSVLKQDKPVMVDFWASWCGPCKMLSPVVDEIASERDDIVVGKVNVDDERELAMRFGVMSIPTVIVFKNGEEYKRSTGAVPKSALLALLD